ncbi:MAG: molybdopterin-binding protein [Eubacteriales bacterium]|nr:molybdopterin-binding protein [Eubacteriales bacterium]
MKEVYVEDAIGMVLCQDLTEIVPGEKKGVAFKKGHVIREEDIPKLLDIGKRHIYVWDTTEGYVHENDAAVRMFQAAVGTGVDGSEPAEGKVSLRAAHDGVVKINEQLLWEACEDPMVCFATIHGNKLVKKGSLLGGTRVIPLVVEEAVVSRFERLCAEKGPLVSVLPLQPCRIGIVTTGSEIKSGRIADRFGPVLRAKAAELGADVVGQVCVGDETEDIKQAILDYIEQGVDLVEVSGGMSVDPDDRTPGAIHTIADEVVTYGTPVLPGAMFMLAYVKGVPVVGLPGCVMFARRTVYDLVVPRLVAGERVTRADIIKLAYGGQCLQCDTCVYPDCGFGY